MTNSNYSHFTHSLVELIQGKGTPQRQIAKSAGIDPAHLCLYLQGKRDLSGEKFYALLTALDLTIKPKTHYEVKGISTVRIDKVNYKKLFERFTAVNFDIIHNDGIVKACDEILQIITEEGTASDIKALRKLQKQTSVLSHSKFTDILYLAFRAILRPYDHCDALELRNLDRIPGFSFDLFPDEVMKLEEEKYFNSAPNDPILTGVNDLPF
mgnify:CR=1 FL=1